MRDCTNWVKMDRIRGGNAVKQAYEAVAKTGLGPEKGLIWSLWDEDDHPASKLLDCVYMIMTVCYERTPYVLNYPEASIDGGHIVNFVREWDDGINHNCPFAASNRQLGISSAVTCSCIRRVLVSRTWHLAPGSGSWCCHSGLEKCRPTSQRKKRYRMASRKGGTSLVSSR